MLCINQYSNILNYIHTKQKQNFFWVIFFTSALNNTNKSRTQQVFENPKNKLGKTKISHNRIFFFLKTWGKNQHFFRQVTENLKKNWFFKKRTKTRHCRKGNIFQVHFFEVFWQNKAKFSNQRTKSRKDTPKQSLKFIIDLTLTCKAEELSKDMKRAKQKLTWARLMTKSKLKSNNFFFFQHSGRAANKHTHTIGLVFCLFRTHCNCPSSTWKYEEIRRLLEFVACRRRVSLNRLSFIANQPIIHHAEDFPDQKSPASAATALAWIAKLAAAQESGWWALSAAPQSKWEW